MLQYFEFAEDLNFEKVKTVLFNFFGNDTAKEKLYVKITWYAKNSWKEIYLSKYLISFRIITSIQLFFVYESA